jgi:hypothetical protein
MTASTPVGAGHRSAPGWTRPATADDVLHAMTTGATEAGAPAPASAGRPAAGRPERMTVGQEMRAVAAATQHQTVPVAVMSLLWLGAACAQTNPPLVVACAPVIAVALWWVWLRRKVRRERRHQVRRMYARVSVLCTVWALWAAACGVLGLPTLALALIGPVVAAGHWWRHRVPTPAEPQPAPPPAPEPAPPVVVVEPERHPVEIRWDERIASRQTLSGSYLTEREAVRGGNRWTIRLVPGEQDFGTVWTHERKIVSALECARDDVVIEPHPSRGEHLATLLVMEDNPLNQTVYWPGPCYDEDTGQIPIGVYADGEQAMWRVHDPGSGLYGGAVIAGSGIGKSRLLESIGASLMHSGRYVVWHGDGQGGASLPHLAQHADWTALDPTEINRMLQAALRGMAYRAKWSALHRMPYFDPTPERPGLIIVLDEVHRFLVGSSTPATQAVSYLAREGRKVGIAVIGADQAPQLPNWGNDDTLRGSLWAGNNVVGRIESKQAGGVIPGLPMPATELPKKKGFFWSVASEEDHHGRTSPFRTLLLADPAAAYEGLPHVQLEPVFTGAAGPDYQDRIERAHRAREQLEAELDALAAGAVLLAPPATAPAPGQPVPAGDLPVLAPEAPTDVDTSTRDRILRAVADGINRNKDIPGEVGLSQTYVDFLLGSMRRNGLVTKANKQAPWELTDAGHAALNTAKAAS